MTIELQDVADQLALIADRLAAAAQMIAETQQVHTELLLRIIQAATADPPEDLLAELLKDIRAAINRQGIETRALRMILLDLPAQLGSAVGAEIRAALELLP